MTVYQELLDMITTKNREVVALREMLRLQTTAYQNVVGTIVGLYPDAKGVVDRFATELEKHLTQIEASLKEEK